MCPTLLALATWLPVIGRTIGLLKPEKLTVTASLLAADQEYQLPMPELLRSVERSAASAATYLYELYQDLPRQEEV